MIGLNIKNLRTKNNMTQKELADKLFVTSQAVSRWENGEVEPSISTMTEIAKIFNISIDVLVNGDFETANEEANKKEPEKEVVVETKYVYDEPVKPVLAVCENCNTPIFDSSGIHRFKTSHRSGRTTHYTDHVYCTKCNDKRIADAKARKIAIEKGKAEVRKKRRIHSFVWPSIVAIGLLVYAIISFVSKNTTLGIWMCVASVSSFTFFACLILQNNVVGDVWVTVAGWSIKWPGLIFELSLDGIIWLITVKLTLAILSFLFGIAVAILATFIGAFISLFIYPFALRNNINNVETEHEEIDL
jgi:transcriptional regulator with XRE-family HTH domain